VLRYDLDKLGWFDFEQLIQTLLKLRLGLGVEAWGGRGDWGRDAYYVGELRYPTPRRTKGPFLFQSKFVEGANAAGAQPEDLIVSSVRHERGQIKKRQGSVFWRTSPTVYALLTNAALKPKIRLEISDLIKDVLPNTQVAIHDGGDICAWLDLSKDVVRSFPQLLSLRDLNELLSDCVNRDVISRSQTAIGLASAHAKVFVPVSAYFLAHNKLQKFSFVVLEGPPEMGKTTIGRIIALGQMTAGWEAIECREPADVLRMYKNKRKQVFVADDFFGRTEYRPERVSRWQDDLPLILPKLNQTHWLILTSRAHLLEMGKARLDVAGENDRFPRLGEVVVNAGLLTRNEKARILYRHAKNACLNVKLKTFVKKAAALTVSHKHFTPERIRRLVVDIIPPFEHRRVSDQTLLSAVDDALSNPTREMTITFRALPPAHRWLLFALLECDGLHRFGQKPELEDRFTELCPDDCMQPYDRVLTELTEAFVKKVPSVLENEDEIDWVHPSCRDLAIIELSADVNARHLFLERCTETGIGLACSFAGGEAGERQLPLLHNAHDWQRFGRRCRELLNAGAAILSIVYGTFNGIKSSNSVFPRRAEALKQLRTLLKRDLLPLIARQLVRASYYSDFEKFKNFYEARDALKLKLDLTLSTPWKECVVDVRDWSASTDAIWQDSYLPESVRRFVTLIQKHQRSFIKQAQTKADLRKMIEQLQIRADAEVERDWDLDNDAEVQEQSEGYASLGRAFTLLGSVAELEDGERTSLLRIGASFREAAESLESELPPDYSDDERPFNAGHESDIDIQALFEDL